MYNFWALVIGSSKFIKIKKIAAKSIMVFILSLLSVSMSAFAAKFVEGEQYTKVSEKITSKPEVREFCSFYAPHCMGFEPLIENVRSKLPAGVKFERNNVDFMDQASRKVQRMLSKAVVVAEQMGMEKKLIGAVFKYLHVQRAVIKSEKDIRKIFVLNGADGEKFDQLMNSYNVNSKAELMEKNQTTLTQKRALTGIPLLLVNGKYRINFSKLDRNNFESELHELIAYLLTLTNAQSKKPKPESSAGISTGTGFFISNDGYFITNSHVIEGTSSISIILNGKSVPATLVDHDSSNDIALLKVDKSVQGLPIELKKKAKQGTEIAVLGYPNIGLQGNEQKATFGFINANSGIQGDTRYFQISSPIQPGNSGSPMVNEKGIVIGIASASLNQSAAIKSTGTLAQNVNYAVKIAYALPMLINHGVEYIEPAGQKALEKTDLIESISNSVVLVVAE